MPMEPWRLAEAENRFEAIQREFLLSWGWQQTCQVPGSYWLWERDFSDYDKKFDAWHDAHPGRPRHYSGVQRVPTDLAISMTIACLYEPDKEEE